MAEGGGLSSLARGSDADFECTCSPCKEDDVIERAVKYCPVCEENMCATCARHHGKLKATRSHILQYCDASIKVPAVTMVTKCRYHPDRDIEMYCEEHDMIYCTMCIATEHRSCRGVLNLVDVNISSNQQKEIERLKSDMSNIRTRLDDTEHKAQTNIVRVEEQRNDGIAHIEEIERELIEHIRKLKHEAMEPLEKEYTVAKENLETNISMIRKVKVEVETECNQLQAVDNLDGIQIFVHTKLMQHTVNDAMKIIEENEATECQDFHFTENKELKDSIMTSTSLCCVETVFKSNSQLSPNVYKVSYKKDINVQVMDEKKGCCISGICQLSDGTIILADYINRRIKRLDVNYNINDYLDVGDYPMGICCTADNEVAVKLLNNKVQLISVESSLSILRDLSVTGGGYWGLAYCTGELLVSTGSGVDVYSMSGTLLKTISNDVNDQNIFKSTTQHIAVSGNTVIVTDYSDGAVCLGIDGTVIRELRDGRLDKTKSVCVSNVGIVFIAGYNSHNIVMFDREGKCLGELRDKDGDLKYPISICYDTKKNCLLVGNYSSNALVVLYLSS